MSGAPRRLRNKLLLRLMLPLLLVVGSTGAIGIILARSMTVGVFDRWLLDAAQSLAHQVHFDGHRATIDLPLAAESVLIFDDVDSVSFAVRQQGSVLIGQAALPAEGDDEARYDNGRAFNATFAGAAVRVARVEVTEGADTATVLVAETTHKRESAQRRIALILLPMALLLLAAAWSIHAAVASTVRSLEVIVAQWRARSQSSLAAIETDELPAELTPFAAALNELLGRIREMLDRERQYATTAAHQLRTPLAGLQLGLARAAEAASLAEVRKILKELEESSLRAARRVQQLLAFARLDPESRRDTDWVETDLAGLVRDVGATFVDLALAKCIDLALEVPETPVMARTHPDLLAEALANLIDNAIRHTPLGGNVTLSVAGPPATIAVDDSGPGVPPAEREQIFERFARRRDAGGEGQGLGLAIAKDIAALHQASLSVADSPLGGCRFEMRFAAPEAAST